MNVDALITSAIINTGVCSLLLFLYSLLRRQPGNLSVYFGRRLSEENIERNEPFSFDRLVPSPSWLKKAYQTPEEEILASNGLDAVIFIRILVFSIRIFSIAAVICNFLLLPLNYYGQKMHHEKIPLESLEVFSISNVKEGSSWLWAHCFALYAVSCSACILLYFEYKSITNMRLAHITSSPPNPSHFTVLVRSIPCSPEESYTDAVKRFFNNYYAPSYLSHRMVYKFSTIQKLLRDAEKMYRAIDKRYIQTFMPCVICRGETNSFKILTNQRETVQDVLNGEEECSAAFVFFKSRYSALVASELLQTSNPMLWVTDLAPEPHDVYWSNLSIPYRQLWIRRIAILVAVIAFVLAFIIPVAFVQGLTHLDQLQQAFPFLKGILKRRKFLREIVTGYLPSVVLVLFLCTVPPMMMLFSVAGGSISRSGRKKDACWKVLYFTIWNVFFVNVFSGSVISQWSVFSSPKDVPSQLAIAVPAQASFFMTYILTSGWTSLCLELVQIFPLLFNLFKRFILRKKGVSFEDTLSFPYHTEVPRVLLFGLLGFTCSILSPLMLPLLLVYYCLAYLVYRNQILNVYISKYESGGLFWPLVHNTTIFSLVLTQIIALGVFGLKESPIASGFTIPLVIFTLLFNEYCRQRFHPIFKNHHPAQVLIDMDREDEQSGRMSEIHQQLHSAYCQLEATCNELIEHEASGDDHGTEDLRPGLTHPTAGRLPISRIRDIIAWLSALITFEGRNPSNYV